jgi:hypothetical protein
MGHRSGQGAVAAISSPLGSSDMIAAEVERVVNLIDRSAFPNRWLPLHRPPVPIFWSAGQAQRFLSAQAQSWLCRSVQSFLAAQMLCRIGSQVRTRLSAGGRWIRTIGPGLGGGVPYLSQVEPVQPARIAVREHRPSIAATSTATAVARISSAPDIRPSLSAQPNKAGSTVAIGCTTAFSWTQSNS